MKKIILALFLFIFFSGKTCAAEPTFLIINQIRGEENCCEPGNLALVQKIINQKEISGLPYGWALRFDAVNNDQYISLLKNLGEAGLLLEITPDLAQKSGVEYRGQRDGTDWYQAKNSFLVGYTQEERKKIIDTLFGAFKGRFGYYPVFTCGWMVDAWSLEYIYKVYGVRLHELTKEQYETDTYTLDGGIFNAPYYPSLNHPLVPGAGNNKLPMIIVRQTVSEILRSYGSTKSYFTSQPNDYLSDPKKKDFSYFRDLIENTLNQKSQFSFGVLGLENSLKFESYHGEYLKQLEYIAKLHEMGKVRLQKPSEYAQFFFQKYPDNQAFYLTEDFSSEKKEGVLWYFGKTYRARLFWQKGKLFLDDIRIYSWIPDPYKDTPASADYAYWIVPYLFESRQGHFGLLLGEGDFRLESKNDSLEIAFGGKSKGVIKLLPEEITIDESLKAAFVQPENLKVGDIFDKENGVMFPVTGKPNFLVKNENGILSAGWMRDTSFIPLAKIIKENQSLRLIPNLDTNNLALLNPIFQPDRSGLPVDPAKSIFYWNNKEAVAGRNPLRLFILPQNKYDRPVQVKKVEVLSKDKEKLEVLYPQDYSFRVKPWFIDIFAKFPIKTEVSVMVDSEIVVKDIPVEFVTDCQKQFKSCLANPGQLGKYMMILINEQRMKLLELLRKK